MSYRSASSLPACVHAVRSIVFVMLVLCATGCASVVYKDSATTFVEAGRSAGKQLEESSKKLDSAEDAVRRIKIESDASCPIGDRHLFVRTQESAADAVSAALARFGNQAALPGCKQLLTCEQAMSVKPEARPATCRTACYSSNEGNCLTQLERSYAIELTTATTGKEALQTESASFAKLLQKTEYQRADSVESMLVDTGVRDLSEYMDLLSKVAEARKSEYPDDAKQLSDRLSSLVKGLSDVSGKELSSSSQATQKQVQAAIGAFGNLAGVLQTMAQNTKDANEIKRLVRDNQVNVEGLISNLRAVALGDGLLAAAYSDQAMRKSRMVLQDKFAHASDAYARSQFLAERDKYPYSDGTSVEKAVNDVFDSLSKAHLALVSLVNDPTDEQKKAIANEKLQNFKTVVKALVDVIQVFK